MMANRNSLAPFEII